MLKVNYQFVERSDAMQKQEESLLSLLAAGKRIISEAQSYKESVISAAEQQAELIVKQANTMAQEKEELLLKEIESKRLAKEKQVQKLKQQMLEVQTKIEALFTHQYDILNMKNKDIV